MEKLERSALSEAIEKSCNTRKEYVSTYEPLVARLLKEEKFAYPMIQDIFGLSEREVINIICDNFIGAEKMSIQYACMERFKNRDFEISENAENMILEFEINLEENININGGNNIMKARISEQQQKVSRPRKNFGKFHNFAKDMSRIYPSKNRKKIGNLFPMQTKIYNLYRPLIVLLRNIISCEDISRLLNIKPALISKDKNLPYLHTRYGVEYSWQISKGKYCIPAELADIIDNFEENLVVGSTIDPEPARYLDVPKIEAGTKNKVEEIVDDNKEENNEDEKMKEETQNQNSNIKFIIPDDYLNDKEHEILDKIVEIFIFNKESSAKEAFKLALEISRISDDSKTKILNCLNPIGRTVGKEDIIYDIFK